MTLQPVLEKLYELEINVEISSFWDGGWIFKVGDKVNGFLAESQDIFDLDEGADWLLEQAGKLYPKLLEIR